MNEIKKIHLDRQAFTISIEAHKALKAYLDAIEQRVGHEDKEVLKEIELRMAEILAERGITAEKVILLEDVEFIKEQLGEPDAFEEDSEAIHANEKQNNSIAEEIRSKRLYRDTDNAWVAGVSSGIAAYMGIDALVIRLLFVVFTITGGAGILIYILLWILVPEAKTPSDRLQMRGKPVTVENIKQLINKADVPAAAGRVSKTTKRVINLILKLIRIFIGVTIILTALALFIAAVVTGAYLLINGTQVGGINIFPHGTKEVVGVLSALSALILLSLGLSLAGNAVLKRKWAVPGWLTATGAGLFIIAVSIGSVVGIDAVPRVKERYDRQYKISSYNLAEFQSVRLYGKDTNLVYIPSNEYRMEVRYFGDKKADDLVKREVVGAQLMLDSHTYDASVKCSGLCFENRKNLHITIFAPTLSEVQINGSATGFEANELPAQKDMILKIGDDTSAYLRHVAAAKASFDTTVPGGFNVLTLTDVRTTSQDATIQITDVVSLAKVDEVSLKVFDGEECMDHEPRLYLTAPARMMSINGQQIESVQQLQRLQNDLGKSLYNCIDVFTEAGI